MQTRHNRFPMTMAPDFACDCSGVQRGAACRDFTLDGFLLYHKGGIYSAGLNPLMLLYKDASISRLFAANVIAFALDDRGAEEERDIVVKLRVTAYGEVITGDDPPVVVGRIDHAAACNVVGRMLGDVARHDTICQCALKGFDYVGGAAAKVEVMRVLPHTAVADSWSKLAFLWLAHSQSPLPPGRLHELLQQRGEERRAGAEVGAQAQAQARMQEQTACGKGFGWRGWANLSSLWDRVTRMAATASTATSPGLDCADKELKVLAGEPCKEVGAVFPVDSDWPYVARRRRRGFASERGAKEGGANGSARPTGGPDL